MSKNRLQLKFLGLLPENDEDGVDEKCAHDMANEIDSVAFLQGGGEFRGLAVGGSSSGLNSTHPVGKPSESHFKAAGAEKIWVNYGGAQSPMRQIMNQADVFYYSGHGDSWTGMLKAENGKWGLAPSTVSGWWSRDLDCAVFSACSVLESMTTMTTTITQRAGIRMAGNGSLSAPPSCLGTTTSLLVTLAEPRQE